MTEPRATAAVERAGHIPPARPSIEERAADPASLDGTLVLCLGYRGADFSGFAAQPGRRTVAGEVTRALETLLRREVALTCAGRTDAGVHALAQYVSVPLTSAELALPERRLMHGLPLSHRGGGGQARAGLAPCLVAASPA